MCTFLYPKYNILGKDKLNTLNMLRCNVIIALIVLSKLGKLHREPNPSLDPEFYNMRELPEINIPKLDNGSYKGTYYDIATIKNSVIVVNGERMSYGKIKSLISCIITVYD